MKTPPKIKLYWDNPPDKRAGLTICRSFAGHEYERRVPPNGLLSSTEAALALRISLRHIYNLVNDRKLKAVRREGRLSFRVSDIKRYYAKGKRRGLDEAWLIS